MTQEKKPRKKRQAKKSSPPQTRTFGIHLDPGAGGAAVQGERDLSQSILRYKVLLLKGYLTTVSDDGSVTVSTLPYQAGSPQSTSKEVTNMSVNGLKKALARLEEPLFDPREVYNWDSTIRNIADRMSGDQVEVTTSIHGGGPIEINRRMVGGSSGSIGIVSRGDGAPRSSMTVRLAGHTAVNKELIYDMYPRAYGSAANVPVFVADIKTVGASSVEVAESVIDGLMFSQCYFDWPICDAVNGGGYTVKGYARFRAEYDPHTMTNKLVGLCRPNFLDPEPPSAPIRVVDTITLNIGEFPTDYKVSARLLARGFLAALDGVIDLGIGFDYDCELCNVSYSALDPMSSDRATLATLGYCRTCLGGDVAQFNTAVPAPF